LGTTGLSSAAVEARDLRKTYKRGRRALDGMSLEIAEGETFGLLGPNGAGKTTFVKILLGLLRANGGTVSLFGHPPDDPEVRRGIGLAAETPMFPNFLTAPEVMRLHGRLAGLGPEEIEDQSKTLLAEAELDGDLGRVKTFSKGMIRRLALAQALLGTPRFVVLDEPTADLDPIGRRDVRNKLEELKSRGVTILLNSHLLSEVERVCDRVAVLHEGRVVGSGLLSELTPKGKDLEEVFIELVEEARGKKPTGGEPK
jgi:ABC-2 type transport system ATP-binding protein